jgi:hypothetical protein
VEKELVKVFEKDTERHLPVVANIVRAVQRKKQLAFPKTQHISISNGVNFSKSVIKVKKFTVFLYNGEVRQFKKISFFFIKVFLYLKNCVYELFIRNARFTRVKLLLPKNGPSGLFGWSPLNCARKPLRLLLCRRISRVFLRYVTMTCKFVCCLFCNETVESKNLEIRLHNSSICIYIKWA